MEKIKELLLGEAKQQGVLRLSGTDKDGNQSITTPEEALRILRLYGPQVQQSEFPERFFWMLK